MEAAPHPWPTLGVLLLRDGLVTKESLEAILDDQRDSRTQRISGRRLGEVLVKRGTVSQTQISKLIAEQYELPFLEIEMSDIDLKVAHLLTEELARRFSAVPIGRRPEGWILLAIADPGTVLFSDELRRELGAPPRFAVVGPEAIASAIAYVHEHGVPAEPKDTETRTGDGVVVELHAVDSAPPLTHDEPFFGSQRAVAHLWPPLGALLIREGLVGETELEAALAQQRLSGGRRLGEILVDRGSVTSADIARLIAEQYELPFVDLLGSEVEPTVGAMLAQDVARRCSAIPIGFLADGSLRVAIAEPTNVLYSDELHRALGVPLSFAIASPDAIHEAIAFLNGETPPAVEEETTSWALVEPEVEVETSSPETTAVEMVAEPVVAELYAVEEETNWWTPVEPKAEVETSPSELTVAEEVAEPLLVEVQVDDAPVVPEPEEPAAIAFVHEQAPPAVEEETTPWAFVEPEVEVETSPFETTAVEEVAEPLLAEVQVDHASVVHEPEEPVAAAKGVETDVVDEVGSVIAAALDLGASDIHFTPQRDALVVRARVDGVMRELTAIPLSREAAATRQLKAMGRLDESEPGRPLEGRASIGAGNETIGFQITVLPTTNGEKVTLHVLDRPTGPTPLTDLGMPADCEEAFRSAIEQPFGMVVACGPTSSGRMTTLYAALQELNTPERTIATIEDPVEYVLSGIDQIDVDPAAGLTFACGLRTIVRSDPDAILVSEIGDAETAQIAVQAAMTGHLILTTLHAQSAASAVQRLTEMGIEPGLLGSTLTCLISQRLARRVCEDCRETYYATATDLAELDRPGEETGRRLLARGRGCSACGGSGFRGRVGLFEVLPLTDELRTLVSERASTTEIQRVAVETGMRTLYADGIRLCLDGVTTAAEVRRVVGN